MVRTFANEKGLRAALKKEGIHQCPYEVIDASEIGQHGYTARFKMELAEDVLELRQRGWLAVQVQKVHRIEFEVMNAFGIMKVFSADAGGVIASFYGDEFGTALYQRWLSSLNGEECRVWCQDTHQYLVGNVGELDSETRFPYEPRD